MKYELAETTVTNELGQAVSTYGIRYGEQEISDIMRVVFYLELA